MILRVFLIGVLLVLLASRATLANPSAAYWKDTSTLTENIKTKGASAVVRALWEDRTAWHYVMKEIASGQPVWVEVALMLRNGSDAGASTDLHDAMFVALINNPELILRVAEPAYPLALLCGGRNDPLPIYEEASREHQKAIAAVAKVNVKELDAKKTQCLVMLQEGEKHLRRFFEVPAK